MFRTWLTPRWLGLTVVLIAVLVGFTWLGLWQFGVAEQGKKANIGTGPQQARVPVTSLMKPTDPFPANGSLRKVSATGHYVPGSQTLVSGRVLGTQSGYWVVTGFAVDGQSAQLPVVRGFVADRAQAVAPTVTPVQLQGALAPGESPSAFGTPAGTLTTVDLPQLMAQWHSRVYNAFVFMTAESPAVTKAPIQVFPPPTPASGGIQLRNMGYAFQWWIFAGFAVYMFARQLREETADRARTERGMMDEVAARHTHDHTDQGEPAR